MLVIALVALVGAGGFAFWSSNRVKGSAAQTADAYFEAWRKGDVMAMERLVHLPPADFVVRHRALSEELHVESLQLTPGALRSTGEESAEVAFAGVRQLAEFGAWPFDSTLRLAVFDRAWKVLWAPETLHPLLKDGGTLELGEIDASAAELVTSEGDKIPNDSYAEAYLDPLKPEFVRANKGWALVSKAPGRPDRQLMTRVPEPDVERTTLSRPVQAAAARALDGVEDSTIIVIRPSTGEILALADRLKDNYSAVRDFFPPGSIFKTITAAALLKKGLDPAAQVACPGTYQIPLHRPFQNDDETLDRGLITFTDAFAHSCNTSFVEQATTRLTGQDLRETADEWGFGRAIATGIGGACGDVPDTADLDMLAADAIGQGQVITTPLCMAALAAAVESGTWRSPRLLSEEQVRRIDGTPHEDVRMDEGTVAVLRNMMAAVVDYGTASGAGLPDDVSGKTGTAEVGDGTSHAWFIGYRDDLAFCVFVRHGGSGGATAAPIAARFLNGL
ncbi:penicillin-binding transpeptidase domain-containing protein [Nonomuraea antimicrobica]|uniref:Penicillin-binding transpeptidase domain-containing protein n=1 Tax=Nonomuraea antimicrobica TaxID=561173 RepID=A0ABP7BRS0_9ACTN